MSGIDLVPIRAIVQDYAMVDACSIVRRTAGAFDRLTGQYTVSEEIIYTGQCMVGAIGQPATRDRVHEHQTEAMVEIGIPHNAPVVLGLDNIVMTAAAWDPTFVGVGFLALGMYRGTFNTHRRIAARVSAPAVVGAATAGTAGDQVGGVNISDRLLVEWTAAGAYQILVTSRDAVTNHVIEAEVMWPDGSGGVYTSAAVDGVTGFINGYGITHELSGKLITQPTITRNAMGQAINKPALVVT